MQPPYWLRREVPAIAGNSGFWRLFCSIAVEFRGFASIFLPCVFLHIILLSIFQPYSGSVVSAYVDILYGDILTGDEPHTP
jgi:hypothetical protein